MQQQWVLTVRGGGVVPYLVARESLGLGADAQVVVVRDDHRRDRGPPRGQFLRVDAELVRLVVMSLGGVGRRVEIVLHHEVRIGVVVRHGGILVGAGQPVDAKPDSHVVMAQRTPQARGLHQQLKAVVTLEHLVVGHVDVAHHGIGDVCADVEGGGPGRLLSRAFAAGGRVPRKDRTGQPELVRSFDRFRPRSSAATSARLQQQPIWPVTETDIAKEVEHALT